MSKVKIVSDPYRRKTQFMSWDGEWVPIEGSNPNSELLQRKFTEGFFPFKAHEMVDIILNEYHDDAGRAELVFEGADDEWSELQDVCVSDDLRGRITLERSDKALANARDILPLIRDVFDEVYPIIAGQADGSTETQRQLKKFREASSDVVPVCVVGNYSAGKSSFINALVGIEILPSGDRPITARVFQIERSDQPDRASVKFRYADEPVHVRFSTEGTRITPIEVKGRIFDDIRAATEKEGTPITDGVRATLGVINSFRSEPNEAALSDLVEVRVPFSPESRWGSDKKVVIFDTPGSNSNTNHDHARVLQDAMRGMSDGLPIYVTTYESLDSNDNADLYKEISEIPALDERFAMIVVNKADSTERPESDQDEEWILDTVVARNLYAQGVYFVSSIVGLGAKTGGAFSDTHYRRTFRSIRLIFEDPEDEDYTQLFRYDLMPEQLRARAVSASEECPNLLLANSGLFSVERGIDAFSTKYSAYNKCVQSDALLHELIGQTDALLEAKGAALESSHELLASDLDQSREVVLDELLQLSLATCEEAVAGYLPSMNEWARRSVAEANLTSDMLAEWEDEITARKQREMNAEEKRRDAAGKRAAVATNLRARVQSAWDTKNMLGLRAIASGFVGDISAARLAEAESELAFHDADREASEALLELVRGQFDADVDRLSMEAEEHSKAYWAERSESTRRELLEFVTNGTALEEEQRETLRQIIIDYHDLRLTTNSPEIREVRHPFDPNRLWKAPLRYQYNAELSQRVQLWRAIVEPSHEECFRDWLHALIDEIEDNVEDINPELREKRRTVRNTKREIEVQRSRRERLRNAERQVSRLMSWQKER
jgi:GTPase SAR1 family protein